MAKKLVIETCFECKFTEDHYSDKGDSHFYCAKDEKCRDIKDPLVIPEWCPLPDEEEQG